MRAGEQECVLSTVVFMPDRASVNNVEPGDTERLTGHEYINKAYDVYKTPTASVIALLSSSVFTSCMSYIE